MHRIAADADGGALSHPELRHLMHRLVRQRAGARDDPDAPPAMDVPGHDTDLPFAGRDHARAVRSDEARGRSVHCAFHLHHVGDRDPFRNADDEGKAGVDRLEDRVGGERRGDEDDAGVRAGLANGLGYGVEHRNPILELLPALARGDACDEVRAVREHLLRVERSRAPGDALAHHAGVPVDEDAHARSPLSVNLPGCSGSGYPSSRWSFAAMLSALPPSARR